MLLPNERCSTCAFGFGKIGAAGESNNRLKGELAAVGAIPFSCHHAPDGRELNWHGSAADFINSLQGRKDLRVCAGWKAAVAGHAKDPQWRKNLWVRRPLAQYAMDVLTAFMSEEKGSAECKELLGRAASRLSNGNEKTISPASSKAMNLDRNKTNLTKDVTAASGYAHDKRYASNGSNCSWKTRWDITGARLSWREESPRILPP